MVGSGSLLARIAELQCWACLSARRSMHEIGHVGVRGVRAVHALGESKKRFCGARVGTLAGSAGRPGLLLLAWLGVSAAVPFPPASWSVLPVSPILLRAAL